MNRQTQSKSDKKPVLRLSMTQDDPIVQWLNHVSGEVNKINEEIDNAVKPSDSQNMAIQRLKGLMDNIKKYEQMLPQKLQDANHDMSVVSDIRVLEIDIKLTKERYDCVCRGGIGLSQLEFISAELKGVYNKVKPSHPYKYSQMSQQQKEELMIREAEQQSALLSYESNSKKLSEQEQFIDSIFEANNKEEEDQNDYLREQSMFRQEQDIQHVQNLDQQDFQSATKYLKDILKEIVNHQSNDQIQEDDISDDQDDGKDKVDITQIIDSDLSLDTKGYSLDKQEIVNLSNNNQATNFEHLIHLIELYSKTHINDLVEIQNDQYIQVLSIGNTGCGKSTMLVSLIEGPEKLAVITIKKQLMSGKISNQKVIGRKDQGDGQVQGFIIGHNGTSSETFLPNFAIVKQQKIIYIDIAGLKDTNGDKVDTLNCIINKMIFSLCKNIKILIPFTQAQIYVSRGMLVREQIALIQKISEADLGLIGRSIQPIITKMKLKHEDNDLELIRSDIDKILQENLTQINKNQQQTQNQTQQIVQNSNENNLEGLVDIDELRKFYIQFGEKTQIFDPLDRVINCPDNGIEENQAVKRDEMIQILQDMPALDGSLLRTPLSETLFNNLIQMMECFEQRCQDGIKKLIEEVKKSKQSQAINKEKDVKLMLRAFQIFENYEILTSQRLINMKQKFTTNLDQQQDIVNEMVLYHQKELEIEKRILDCKNIIIAIKNQKYYETLISYLIQFYGYMHEIESEMRNKDLFSQQKLDEMIEKIKITFYDTIQWLMQNPDEFLNFGYHLKKKQCVENLSIDYFLDEKQYNEQQKILIQIVESNFWDAHQQKMKSKDHVYFTISQEYQNDSSAIRYLQFSKTSSQNEQGFMRPFLDSKLNQGHSLKFQFVLTEKGVNIQNGNGYRLLTENGRIKEPSLSMYMVQMGMGYAILSNHEHAKFNDSKCAFWCLKTDWAKIKDPLTNMFKKQLRFKIEMPYGDRQPRLISQQCMHPQCQVNKFIDQNLLCVTQKQYGVIVTTSHEAGYSNDFHYFWNIQLYEQSKAEQQIIGVRDSEQIPNIIPEIIGPNSDTFVQEIARPGLNLDLISDGLYNSVKLIDKKQSSDEVQKYNYLNLNIIKHDDELAEMILPFSDLVLAHQLHFKIEKPKLGPDEQDCPFKSICEVISYLTTPDQTVKIVEKLHNTVQEIVKKSNTLSNAPQKLEEFTKIVQVLLLFKQLNDIVPETDLQLFFMKVMDQPNDKYKAILPSVQNIFWWINRALSLLKPKSCNCIRTAFIKNHSEFDYYQTGKVFRFKHIVSASFLDSSDTVQYQDSITAINTNFANQKSKSRGKKVIFHIYSQNGKCVDEFLWKDKKQNSQSTIAFEAGSQFLVCNRENQMIDGYNILNVYLREIQIGVGKDIVLWLDTQENMKYSNVFRKILVTRKNQFQSSYQTNEHPAFILKNHSEVALAYLRSDIFREALKQCQSFKILQNQTRPNENDIVYAQRPMLPDPKMAAARFCYELFNLSNQSDSLRDSLKQKAQMMITCRDSSQKEIYSKYSKLLKDSKKVHFSPLEQNGLSKPVQLADAKELFEAFVVDSSDK